MVNRREVEKPLIHFRLSEGDQRSPMMEKISFVSHITERDFYDKKKNGFDIYETTRTNIYRISFILREAQGILKTKLVKKVTSFITRNVRKVY